MSNHVRISGFQYVIFIGTDQPPATPPPPNGQCRSQDWISYGNKCYRFYYQQTSMKSYLNAALTCAQQTSTMISVHSSDDNKFILNMLKSFTVQSEGLWIGLHKTPGLFLFSIFIKLKIQIWAIQKINVIFGSHFSWNVIIVEASNLLP